MLPWVFIALVTPVQCALPTTGFGDQLCNTSSDCKDGQCCRDIRTKATLVNNPNIFWKLDHGRIGQCVVGGAKPHEACDFHCPCPQGHKCYQQLTGVCCLPRTCITNEEYIKQQLRDMCFPPPMAANLRPAEAKARKHRSKLDLVCKLLMRLLQ